MADIAITATAVKLADSNSQVNFGVAGATITQGQPVYFDTVASNYKTALDLSAAQAKAAGIALQSVSVGQQVQFITAGNLTINAVGVPGKQALVSPNAGGITATDADVVAGHFGTILGIFTSTTNLLVNITPSGVAR